jgi:pimeloyl-ACP methyl ester carboxylesterase
VARSKAATTSAELPFIIHRAARAFLGDYWLRQVRQACARWPRGALPAGYRDPVASDVPTLLISGFLDPATPPRGGEEEARTLRNSRHAIVRNGSHSFAGLAGCVDRIIADFVRSASVSSLDGACAERVARPRFATALSSRAP